MHFETQLGALANQLNMCLLANVSMIGVLFSFKGWTAAGRTQSTYGDRSVDIMGKP